MVVRRCLAVLCLVLAGACLRGQGSTDARPQVTGSDPHLLARDWSVQGSGIPEGLQLILRVRQTGANLLVLKLPCGKSEGEWATDRDQQLFFGNISGTSSACYNGEVSRAFPGQDWMERVAGYRADGQRRLLVDASGQTVATLTPVPYDRAAAPVGAVGGSMPPPVPSPAALPPGVRAPSVQELVRSWLPLEPATRSDVSLAFAVSGAWNVTGCPGGGGRYLLGRAGRLLVSTSPFALATWCGPPVSNARQWIAHTSRVGLVDGQLVFYDRTAKELGRARSG